MDIERIAALAKMHLKPESKQKLEKDLGNILSYIDKLSSLDTKDVPPTSHVLELENVFRQDISRDAGVIDEALQAATNVSDTFFRVPRVIEGDG